MKITITEEDIQRMVCESVMMILEDTAPNNRRINLARNLKNGAYGNRKKSNTNETNASETTSPTEVKPQAKQGGDGQQVQNADTTNNNSQNQNKKEKKESNIPPGFWGKYDSFMSGYNEVLHGRDGYGNSGYGRNGKENNGPVLKLYYGDKSVDLSGGKIYKVKNLPNFNNQQNAEDNVFETKLSSRNNLMILNRGKLDIKLNNDTIKTDSMKPIKSTDKITINGVTFSIK